MRQQQQQRALCATTTCCRSCDKAVVAIARNKKYVLKIFSENSAYILFVEYAKKHEHNQHVPIFYQDINRVPGTEFLYVRTEKLSKVTNDMLITDYSSEMMALYLKELTSKIFTIDKDIQEPIDKILTTQIPGFDEHNPDEDLVWQHMRKPDDDWLQLVDDLIDICHRVGHNKLDLKVDNFMLRGKTLVVIDPLYG